MIPVDKFFKLMERSGFGYYAIPDDDMKRVRTHRNPGPIQTNDATGEPNHIVGITCAHCKTSFNIKERVFDMSEKHRCPFCHKLT